MDFDPNDEIDADDEAIGIETGEDQMHFSTTLLGTHASELLGLNRLQLSVEPSAERFAPITMNHEAGLAPPRMLSQGSAAATTISLQPSHRVSESSLFEAQRHHTIQMNPLLLHYYWAQKQSDRQASTFSFHNHEFLPEHSQSVYGNNTGSVQPLLRGNIHNQDLQATYAPNEANTLFQSQMNLSLLRLRSQQPVDSSTFRGRRLVDPEEELKAAGNRCLVEPFPERLHRLLMETEKAGQHEIISFTDDGKAFEIHKPDRFFKEIVPKYFKQSRLSSFKRQLNLYGFELISSGPTRGGYRHERFQKDNPLLCRTIRRRDVKYYSKSSKITSSESTLQADQTKTATNHNEESTESSPRSCK